MLAEVGRALERLSEFALYFVRFSKVRSASRGYDRSGKAHECW